MKINWFHLMPYRWLPEDFRERYRSVWVDIPGELWNSEKGHYLYNEYLDELEFADRSGFDGICVNEHHANAYGLMPSPNIMAACLARRTSRANLVVLGDSLALYNPPLRVAEEFAMLDCISGGRLVAGFPVGSSMDTNFAYGATPATLRERYREAHDLIIKAWTTQCRGLQGSADKHSNDHRGHSAGGSHGADGTARSRSGRHPEILPVSESGRPQAAAVRSRNPTASPQQS